MSALQTVVSQSHAVTSALQTVVSQSHAVMSALQTVVSQSHAVMSALQILCLSFRLFCLFCALSQTVMSVVQNVVSM